MAENDKPTVVTETDTQAKPETEATDARTGDELDALLREFETQAKPETTPSKPETKPDATSENGSQKRLDALEQQLTDWRFQQDIKPVIDKVRGDIDPAIYDDDDVRDWIDRQAKADPRLAQAWLDRHKDPAKFGRVVEGLGKKLSARFSKLPDKQATEDREAVTAAVRGASNRAPEGKAPSYGGLSDNAFAEQVEKEHGFRPL
jgi:hypothetical protein